MESEPSFLHPSPPEQTDENSLLLAIRQILNSGRVPDGFSDADQRNPLFQEIIGLLADERQTLLDLTHEAQSAHQQFEEACRVLREQLVSIEALQEQLRQQAVRDPLTACFNRRYMEETLDRELARATRENYPVCLAMVDIDHFKQVNDAYGRSAGDEVLRTLGALLRHFTRAGDLVCRYGGEEFLVVLPNIHLLLAAERSGAWRRRVEQTPFPTAEKEIRVTISLGLAAFPLHGSQKGQLIECADQALLHAKQSGRNRIEVFGTSMPFT